MRNENIELRGDVERRNGVIMELHDEIDNRDEDITNLENQLSKLRGFVTCFVIYYCGLAGKIKADSHLGMHFYIYGP